MAQSQDFLNEIIEESTALDPQFPLLVEAAMRRCQLLRDLVARRT